MSGQVRKSQRAPEQQRRGITDLPTEVRTLSVAILPGTSQTLGECYEISSRMRDQSGPVWGQRFESRVIVPPSELYATTGSAEQPSTEFSAFCSQFADYNSLLIANRAPDELAGTMHYVGGLAVATARLVRITIPAVQIVCAYSLPRDGNGAELADLGVGHLDGNLDYSQLFQESPQ